MPKYFVGEGKDLFVGHCSQHVTWFQGPNMDFMPAKPAFSHGAILGLPAFVNININQTIILSTVGTYIYFYFIYLFCLFPVCWLVSRPHLALSSEITTGGACGTKCDARI